MNINNIIKTTLLTVMLAVLPISAISACPCTDPEPETTTEEEQTVQQKQNG